MSVSQLSVDTLAQRCAEETEKFSRRQSNDPQFCFELFRRALVDGVEDAITRLFQIYERQLRQWVHNHSGFVHTGEDADFFVGAAMRTFYFALRGPKFERFPSLPQVLQYLKTCVHTAIAQYIRDQQPSATTPIDDATEVAHTPDLGNRADAAELWAYIVRLLPDERDRSLARYVFLQDLKPRQIVALYPQQWGNERDVSVALYRVRRTLRNDPELVQRAGLQAHPTKVEDSSAAS
jgi:hypothetical protein